MKYTIQVAPEDCTGCGICVDVCPVKNKSEVRLKAINMVPQPPLRAPESENWDFFLKTSGTRSPQDQGRDDPPAAGAGTAVRVLRRLLGMRRNSLSEAGFAAVRRPRDRGQCNRLLFDLRRQPADDALGEERATAAGRHGRIPCSKTTPNSASASASPSTSRPSSRTSCCSRVAGSVGEELVTAILTAKQKDEADIYEQRQRVDLLKEKLAKAQFARRQTTSFRRRHAGQEERLDRRRRRLGL